VFGKVTGDLQRRFSQFKRLRAELAEKYPQTFVPPLREDMDPTDNNMKVRVTILTLFMYKLLSNKDLMDPKTKRPVEEIMEFFNKAKDVDSE
jgi:PX domain